MKHGYILLLPRKILYFFIFYSSLFFAVIGGNIKKEKKIKKKFPSCFFSFKSLPKSFIKMVPSVTCLVNGHPGTVYIRLTYLLNIVCLFFTFVFIHLFVLNTMGWGAGAGCFWLLGAGAAWKKSQEPEPLKISRLLR